MITAWSNVDYEQEFESSENTVLRNKSSALYTGESP